MQDAIGARKNPVFPLVLTNTAKVMPILGIARSDCEVNENQNCKTRKREAGQ